MEEGGRRRQQKGARKQGSRQEGRKAGRKEGTEGTEGGRKQPAFKKLEAFTWKAGKMRLEI